ncbi:DinB family protein [Ureibacillus sp. FSL K6-8385]|uniref:DinB family protein n=1 Tax=Ureibacillus terrenus TaxID=118246 RepID=A0A540V567_9BACL|nr:DinB family protein [Ureibacillus terrenus]MED3662156.1 DinB family protein [Ureibacillus terrenus]MED3764430.1 DinB family protein [Ureibacillus terrenus]TQE91900.1 DinB family protein [Ureibacillus terrenus]
MEKIQQTREKVLNSVCFLSDEQLNEVPEKGKWSIAQVLEHLYLMEMNTVDGILETLSKDEYNPVEEKPLHHILDRTVKRVAPDDLTPSGEFQTLEELKRKLSKSREALLKSIEGVSEEELENKSFIHRRYGLLSIRQWVSLIGYHEERHLQQIEEIKESLLKKAK